MFELSAILAFFLVVSLLGWSYAEWKIKRLEYRLDVAEQDGREKQERLDWLSMKDETVKARRVK